MRNIRVATVQFQHAPSDKSYNLGRVRHFVAEAARSGVEIVAFPEMCLTGYWHVRKLDREAFEALAEPVPAGPCTRELRRLSSEHGMTIGAGLLERADDGRVYNSYVSPCPTTGGKCIASSTCSSTPTSRREIATRYSIRRTAAGWAY